MSESFRKKETFFMIQKTIGCNEKMKRFVMLKKWINIKFWNIIFRKIFKQMRRSEHLHQVQFFCKFWKQLKQTDITCSIIQISTFYRILKKQLKISKLFFQHQHQFQFQSSFNMKYVHSLKHINWSFENSIMTNQLMFHLKKQDSI